MIYILTTFIDYGDGYTVSEQKLCKSRENAMNEIEYQRGLLRPRKWRLDYARVEDHEDIV